MFQSLTGMLKTKGIRRSLLEVRVFQSLIGMLKTTWRRLPAVWAANVSIPHRYAENLSRRDVLGRICGVSIPHRYAENSVPKNGDHKRKESFNPS